MENPITDSLRAERRCNVHKIERYASIALGAGLLATSGQRRLASPSLPMVVLGGVYLLYRGVTGYCPLLHTSRLRRSAAYRPDLQQKFGEGKRDVVEEASWESFPASDPPAW